MSYPCVLLSSGLDLRSTVLTTEVLHELCDVHSIQFTRTVTRRQDSASVFRRVPSVLHSVLRMSMFREQLGWIKSDLISVERPWCFD